MRIAIQPTVSSASSQNAGANCTAYVSNRSNSRLVAISDRNVRIGTIRTTLKGTVG